MTGSVLIATDLDQTLIYSRRAVTRYGGGGGALAAVETYQDVDASFMTASAAAAFARLGDQALVVPATTRTAEQLARVRIPGAPKYAVAANGGVLLVDGVPDEDWRREVGERLTRGTPVGDVVAHARAVCRPEWTRLVRVAADLFCYAVLERRDLPASLVADESAWASERGWQVSLQGRKLYWVPAALTKSAAVAEVARREAASTLLAAGDSLLDADLLAAADAGIMARHGELAASGWRAEHVRVTAGCGITAGAEIVRWFAGQVCR